MILQPSEKPVDGFRESGVSDLAVTRLTAVSDRFSLLNDMIVSRGTRADWDLLHELHYKAEGTPLGPKFWKTTLHGETIGVLVTGLSKGLCKERHVAFPKMKPAPGNSKLVNVQRYAFINAHFRVVGRFVFDTLYRGIGCGYRMLNLVARMENPTFMEIQSSMAKFNHFGQMAGYKFVKPMNSNVFDKGMVFIRENFESNPQDYEALIEELEAMSPAERRRTIEGCRRFYFRNSAKERTGDNRGRGIEVLDHISDRQLIRNLHSIILMSPMYGVYKNPDKGRTLPSELPLTAFDRQAPHEPLVF